MAGEVKDNWLVDGGRLVLHLYPARVPVAAVEPELAWTTALRCAVPEIPEEVVSRRGRLVEQAADGRAAVLTRVISVEPPGEDDETSGGAPPGGWTMPGASAVSRPTGGSAR